MIRQQLSTLVILTLTLLLLSCGSSDDGDNSGTELGQVFVSSNTTPVIGIYDFSNSSEVTSVQFGTSSTDSDGIIYSSVSDELYVASRTNNRVEVYTDLTETEASANLTLAFSSSSDFTNARKLAFSGSNVLVSQDAASSNNNQNRFFVYSVSNGSATLQNTYDPQINLWDVQFVGNTLYAVEDNSDTLAVYNDLLNNNDGVVIASQKVQIEGIVRTHALFYSASADIMFMSDIGDAGSDSDGAIHIITNFSAKLTAAGQNGSIAIADQIIIEGNNTELGNPVGLAYDPDNAKIYVAERAVGGGKLLEFDLPASNGNLSPSFSQNFSGAAAVYFVN